METIYIVNNKTGQTINGESVTRPYKVYSALLFQEGEGAANQTSGDLIIGARYRIDTYNTGDDFSNVANVISGVVNTTGCEFIATGTTPTDYSNESLLYDTSAPIATVLENTIGNVIWSYDDIGSYFAELRGGNFDVTKTFINVTNGYYSNPYTIFGGVWEDDNTYLLVQSFDSSQTNTNIDGSAFIEIRVYN